MNSGLSSSIRLRVRTVEDAQWLFGLYAEQRQAELEAWGWPMAQREEFLRMQFHAQDLHYQNTYPQGQCHIVLVDNILAGRCYTAELSSSIHVVDISLLSAFRGQGIGTWLLRNTIQSALAVGKGVSLQVDGNNPAKRLYQKLGFVATGTDGVYWSMEFPAISEGSGQ